MRWIAIVVVLAGCGGEEAPTPAEQAAACADAIDGCWAARQVCAEKLADECGELCGRDGLCFDACFHCDEDHRTCARAAPACIERRMSCEDGDHVLWEDSRHRETTLTCLKRCDPEDGCVSGGECTPVDVSLLSGDPDGGADACL